MKNDLKDLSDPKKFHDLISIDNQDVDELKNFLSTMLLIRKTEHQLAFGKKKQFNWWTSASWCWSRGNCCWRISEFKKN